MDRRHVLARWSVVKGRIRELIGRLVDNDLEVIAGQRDQLIGRIQELYGYARDEAERRADRLVGTI